MEIKDACDCRIALSTLQLVVTRSSTMTKQTRATTQRLQTTIHLTNRRGIHHLRNLEARIKHPNVNHFKKL